ncbi:MAG: hypothetical protein Q8Q40_10055 [Methylococcaceae bacterium]|nr:hypothetical protein [Methylococcaceae bacterium]MDP3904307.1 hypothetical protein [Methylococcaceae bacterium]
MTTPFMPPSDLRRPQVRVAKTRPFGIVTYPGVEILDFTGPMEAFAFANHGLQRSGICSELAYPMDSISGKALADNDFMRSTNYRQSSLCAWLTKAHSAFRSSNLAMKIA